MVMLAKIIKSYANRYRGRNRRFVSEDGEDETWKSRSWFLPLSCREQERTVEQMEAKAWPAMSLIYQDPSF